MINKFIIIFSFIAFTFFNIFLCYAQSDPPVPGWEKSFSADDLDIGMSSDGNKILISSNILSSAKLYDRIGNLIIDIGNIGGSFITPDGNYLVYPKANADLETTTINVFNTNGLLKWSNNNLFNEIDFSSNSEYILFTDTEYGFASLFDIQGNNIWKKNTNDLGEQFDIKLSDDSSIFTFCGSGPSWHSCGLYKINWSWILRSWPRWKRKKVGSP